MDVTWLPANRNPAYAGVRLRCLLPISELQRAVCRVRLHGGTAGTIPELVVVQAKWLLDAGSPQMLNVRLAELHSLKLAGARLMLDSFDNYFVNRFGDSERAALLQAYRRALPIFDAFSVSSPGLLPLLREAIGDARPVHVIGDPVEVPGMHRQYESVLLRWNPRRWPNHLEAWRSRREVSRRRRHATQCLWFGNHGSSYATGGLDELRRIVPALNAAFTRHRFELTVVSNSFERYREVLMGATFDHRYWEWDRIHFAGFAREHDLVLLPVPADSFGAAKSDNRLLLPLSLGVPVVSDAIPAYLPWQQHFARAGWDQLHDLTSDLEPWRQRAHAAWPAISRTRSLEAIGRSWRDCIESCLRA
jgi:hypothetical protein